MAVRLCPRLVAVAAAAAVGAAAPDVSRHSVIWTDLLAEPGQTDVVNERTYATYHNAMPVGNGHITAMIGKGCYFLVFVPTIREIRDFYREM